MREHEAAATTAGILYITGTVAGVLSKVVSAPVRDAGDPLAAAAGHSGAVVTGALLVLVMGLSLAFIPVVLFPVLRRVDEVLAVGYLIVRGAVETVCYVVVAIGWLPARATRRCHVGRTGHGVSGRRASGQSRDRVRRHQRRAHARVLPWCPHVLRPALSVADRPPLDRVVGLLSSRFTWPPTCSRCMRSSASTPPRRTCCSSRLGVQEMVLAAWMIARGFRPAAVSTTPELADGTLRARTPARRPTDAPSRTRR